MRDDEAAQIHDVIQRLAKRHPDICPTVVESTVQRIHVCFANSSVREFVPLLVERRAGRELADT